jgi:hypothetical protein
LRRLTAAKLIAETAGAERLASDAKFARLAGVAPIPPPRPTASATASIVAATASSTAPFTASPSPRTLSCPAREFLAKKQAEGKTRIEALRCLKRHLARRVWKLLVNPEREISMNTVDTQRGKLTPQIGGGLT